MKHFVAFLILVTISAAARADDWKFKSQLLPLLANQVPGILKGQDAKTGRFGTGVYTCQDQNIIYPLAVAWATQGNGNPFYHDDKLLNAIMAGGDALIADAKPDGTWVFRKKDGSEWGDIYMPWTYSRWIRAYSLIKDAMPAERRAKWEKALNLGFDGIIKTVVLKKDENVQNIPAHDAMATYLAGKVLNHPEWCDVAKAYMKRVIGAQYPDGYWTEHVGPVINYGIVYVEAVGIYYAMSHDPDILPALNKAAAFHMAFVYPDLRPVETVDERNGYDLNWVMPSIGFTFTTPGRSWSKLGIDERIAKKAMGADLIATYLLYGEEGEVQPTEAAQHQHFVTQDGHAVTTRNGPWFACVSGYTAPVSDSRWIQDRQNFISLFHDKEHVIVGGGNTKLQPLWSTFTVGDPSLLSHTPHDENPKFIPPAGLLHTPSDSVLDADHGRVTLVYGDVKCAASIDISDAAEPKLVYELLTPTDKRVEAHVTLVPQMKAKWQTASGKSGELGDEPIKLIPGEAGDWFGLSGWRISVPPQASITWPVKMHDQYRKDGESENFQARIVMTLPMTPQNMKYELTVERP